MREFAVEFQTDYSTYSFGYTQYCVQESEGEIAQIYQNGYLPYSANTQLIHPVYYRARSLRINLDRYSATSENKRVNKGVLDLDIQLSCKPKQLFPINDENFFDFCLGYAKKRFSHESMSPERLQYIFNRPIGTHLFSFDIDQTPLGYVYTVQGNGILHYWFAFFDVKYLQSHSIGKWMMYKVVQWAKENDFRYVYLGTCYGSHSLYKVRDFNGIEFFNGSCWSNDKKALKVLCKHDSEISKQDAFKKSENANIFIETLLKTT